MKAMNRWIIVLMFLLLIGISYAADLPEEIVNKRYGELDEVEEGKVLEKLEEEVESIVESKAYEQKDEETKGEILDELGEAVDLQDTVTVSDTLQKIERIKEKYGIIAQVKNLMGNWGFRGLVGGIVALAIGIYMHKRKTAKGMAKRSKGLVKSEKKRVEEISELLKDKEPKITENKRIIDGMVGEIEFLKEIKAKVVDQDPFTKKHGADWMFKVKSFGDNERRLLVQQIGGERMSKLIGIGERGFAIKRLTDNQDEIESLNNKIVSNTKALMRFEGRYDREAKRLEIKLEKGETEMGNFYKKFIVWRREEVIIDREATMAKIQEHIKTLKADQEEGIKEFREEAEKAILIYHFKQQLVNAIEGKVKVEPAGKETRTAVFGGEKTNLNTQRGVIRNFKNKFLKEDDEGIESDIRELMHSSNRIKQLYERWEVEVVKRLIEELKIHDRLSKLNEARVKELGGATKLGKHLMKKAGAFGKEREMDKIVHDIRNYTVRFGETVKRTVRDKDDLKKRIIFIIDDVMKRSKKRFVKANMDYLNNKLSEYFDSKAAMKEYEESHLFDNMDEMHAFAHELTVLVRDKTNQIKATLEK